MIITDRLRLLVRCSALHALTVDECTGATCFASSIWWIEEKQG